jgi:diacylglycerol kinase (ATP)
LLHILLKQHALQYQIVETSKQDEATSLAERTHAEIIIAVGGDGTINEVSNGLVGTTKVLGVIPAGSGNDFVKSIGVSKNPHEALQHLLARNIRRIDVGEVIIPDVHGNSFARYFVNGVGIGFDAAVAATSRRIRFLTGTLLYATAVFKTLGSYRAPLYSIRTDSRSQQSRLLLMAIGNGPCAGGGFYLTPDAQNDDGKLDVCLIDDMHVGKIMRLMPKVLKGAHMTFPGVQMRRANEIHVTAESPFYVHADGEIVGSNVHEVHVRLREKSLDVIIGLQ